MRRLAVEVAAHLIVKGMVQGVGFRYFVVQHARRLNLKGYVRNLPSGDVEIEVEGERGLIEELIAMVKVGPRWADVQDVQAQWIPFQGRFGTFEVRF